MGQVAKRCQFHNRCSHNAVKRLDLTVAPGVVEGREQRLDAVEETHTCHLADDAPIGVPTAEGAFVVELLQLRLAQIRPVFRRKLAGAGDRLLMEGFAQPDCVAVDQ